MVRLGAHKRDMPGHFVTMGAADHFLMRQGRTHVVDTKIERCDSPWSSERHDDRSTTGRVDQAGDAATVKHLCLGVAYEIHAIRKGQGEMLRPVVHDSKTQCLVVRNCADVTPLEASPDFIFLRKKRVGHGPTCSRPGLPGSRRELNRGWWRWGDLLVEPIVG